MKAIVCEQPGRLAIVERPRPERRSGEVLLKMRRIGLCGTDYHIFAGNQPFLEYPRVIGHELAAEVEDADRHAPFAPGQVVTINPYLACGGCIACRKGKPNCCSAITVLGVHVDGGLCEYLAVPESAVVPVGDLSLDQAAMVEFLAVGAHAVRRARFVADDRVLVVGAGPIGVAVALAARIEGARVTLTDTNADRLRYASTALGFSSIVAAGDTDRLSALTDGEYFDCVFDATGNAAAMNAGLAYVAHGGTYVLVSVVKDDIVLPDPEFHKRETTLMGSRNAIRADFERVIERIADGSIPTAALHTHSFPALETGRRMPELIADQGSVLKAIAAF